MKHQQPFGFHRDTEIIWVIRENEGTFDRCYLINSNGFIATPLTEHTHKTHLKK